MNLRPLPLVAHSLTLLLAASSLLPACATTKQHNELAAKEADDANKLAQDNATLRAQVDALQLRLDNALKANADTGTDVLSHKAQLRDLTGRTDELAHAIEEVRKDLGSTRTELSTQIDEVKRAQASGVGAAPTPVATPADRATHLAQLEQAYDKKDWPTLRTLGDAYATRYPQDDQADDALFLTGDGDLQDNRPSSALGEFNRLLKLYPRSNRLGAALFDMGEAYLALHDCDNAKLAFGAVEDRFPKEKIAADAKKRLGALKTPSPGTCAPQT